MVSLPEVDAVIQFAEAAMSSTSSLAWKEIRRGLASAAEYLHAVGVIQVASLLRVHHPTINFVTTSATTREPDLMLEVTDGLPLAVEVKALKALWQPSRSLDMAEARHLIRNAVASAGIVQGQLRAGRPGILALTGLLMSKATYDTMAMCFEHHLLSEGAHAPHLLGFALANLRMRVESTSDRVSPLLEQQSTLRRNPSYAGALWIDDDWAKPWRLVRR